MRTWLCTVLGTFTFGMFTPAAPGMEPSGDPMLVCWTGQPPQAAQQGPASRPASDPWQGLVSWAEGELGPPGKEAAEFLRRYRPERDQDIDRRILEDTLQLALQARGEFPWAKELDPKLFLNDVLPYAVIDETRENWRPEMYARARDIVQGCTTAADAAQRLNGKLFDVVNVHYSTQRERANQSPAESIRQGKASCTGLSILLVDACRSVGIPARLAGVGRWTGKNGNHTWVEIHDGERWRFTGADEFDPKGLDRAWFTGDAARALRGHPTQAVMASSWRTTGRWFALAWNEGAQLVPGVDVTDHYTGQPQDAAAEGGTTFFRAWRGDQRVVADLRIETEDGTQVVALRTRAGRSDLNDMPGSSLQPGQSYRAVLTRDGITRSLPFTPKAGNATVELRELEMGLDLANAERVLQRLTQQAWADRRADLERDLQDQTIRAAGKELRLKVKPFGDVAKGKRSLWISMHGGGGAPAEVNDRQWNNQIRLYQPKEGIYVAPRAPTDTWNLWHQAHVDPLLDRLIEAMVVTEGVDPNRVYLMGYSAGGDGVFQLAPRMADRFAAAAMMAGHPNETQPDSLRNLPFMIFMGGKDSAYKRNEVAAAWGQKLATLRQADPGGYPHKVTIYPECGHWMDGRDKEALPWMAARFRTPWPKKVVWRQDDVLHRRLYWLAVDPSTSKAGHRITAEVVGNVIRLDAEGPRSVQLLLRDELIPMDQPIQVIDPNGETTTVTVLRTEACIAESLQARRDPTMTPFGRVQIDW